MGGWSRRRFCVVFAARVLPVYTGTLRTARKPRLRYPCYGAYGKGPSHPWLRLSVSRVRRNCAAAFVVVLVSFLLLLGGVRCALVWCFGSFRLRLVGGLLFRPLARWLGACPFCLSVSGGLRSVALAFSGGAFLGSPFRVASCLGRRFGSASRRFVVGPAFRPSLACPSSGFRSRFGSGLFAFVFFAFVFCPSRLRLLAPSFSAGLFFPRQIKRTIRRKNRLTSSHNRKKHVFPIPPKRRGGH